MNIDRDLCLAAANSASCPIRRWRAQLPRISGAELAEVVRWGQ